MKLDSKKLVVVILIAGIIFAQNYNAPESAVYDAAGERWLISNWGNGDIIARANDGSLTYFNQDASIASGGMAIVGNTLYVAGSKSDGSQTLFGFDLATGALINTTIIIGFTSDVTADATGNVYVSDTDKIYQVDPTAQTYSTIYTGGSLNGVLFDDANNRLLFTDDSPISGSQIMALDMTTMTVSVVVATAFGGLDGLTVDQNGNYYVSSWMTAEIYRYDSNFTNLALAATLPDGAADIHFDIGTATMAAPTFGGNSVVFIPFAQLSATDAVTSLPSEFQIHQNFPNPFNPNTTIFYDVSRESNVKVTVFDLLGREVIKLVDRVEPAGNRSINWDGRDYTGNLVNAGVYIYQIDAEGFLQTKKMVLMK